MPAQLFDTCWGNSSFDTNLSWNVRVLKQQTFNLMTQKQRTRMPLEKKHLAQLCDKEHYITTTKLLRLSAEDEKRQNLPPCSSVTDPAVPSNDYFW